MSTAIVQAASSTTDKLVDRILDFMEQRELKVGDQLPSIREFSKLFDCKATAVRDALLQAQALGLVRVLPRAGAFVQKTARKASKVSYESLAADFESLLSNGVHSLFHLLDARRVIEMELGLRTIERNQIEDLLPLRETLESMAAIPLAERRAHHVELDIQFHVQIARLGGNPVLVLVLETVLERLRPCLERLPWDVELRRKTDQSHVEIYQALVNGDAKSFQAEIIEHQSTAYNSLLLQVRTPPEPHLQTLG